MKILPITGFLFISLVVLWHLQAQPLFREFASVPEQKLISLSEELLLNVRMEFPTAEIESDMARIKMAELVSGLSNDRARKAFWVNTYNAWYQILAGREKMTKPDIFRKRVITIAETSFSLDDIEHGILRKYRWKLGLGYLPQFFPPKRIIQLSVSKVDYRIHFALNCGATSCPPITFYTYHNLDEQLEQATSVFLNGDTDIDEENKEVRISKIMKWFKGDFGGNRGIKHLLSQYLEKDLKDYTICYQEYNWNEQLKNFTVESKNTSLPSRQASEITCPQCGHKKNETMPADACQIYYVCENCSAILRPLEGDCCVYCSYGSAKCPSKQ